MINKITYTKKNFYRHLKNPRVGGKFKSGINKIPYTKMKFVKVKL